MEIVEGTHWLFRKAAWHLSRAQPSHPKEFCLLYLLFSLAAQWLWYCVVFVTRFQQCLGPRTLVVTQHEVTGAQWRWKGWSSTLNDDVPCTHPTLLPPVGQLLQLVMCTM